MNFGTGWELPVPNRLQRQVGSNSNNRTAEIILRSQIFHAHIYLPQSPDQILLYFSSLLQICYFIFQKQGLTVYVDHLGIPSLRVK